MVPLKQQLNLEGSKTFSKDFFIKYGIPTAAYASFDHYDALKLSRYIEYPTVVKADGLLLAKESLFVKIKKMLLQRLDSIFKDQAFGEAGSRVVIEDFLEGEEAVL